MPTRWILSGLAVVGATILARSQLARLFVEEPEHEIERTFDGIEVRRYASVVRAETTVAAASAEDAIVEGFGRLAAYIGGRNVRRAVARKAAHLALATHAFPAPCDVAPLRPERLPLTAPVTRTACGEGRWIVTFSLPRGRTRADLPSPEDARVSLRSVPARRIAALRYRGSASFARAESKALEFRERLAAAGIAVRGEVIHARYDPPWVFPLLRRNEVWIELA